MLIDRPTLASWPGGKCPLLLLAVGAHAENVRNANKHLCMRARCCAPPRRLSVVTLTAAAAAAAAAEGARCGLDAGDVRDADRRIICRSMTKPYSAPWRRISGSDRAVTAAAATARAP